MRLARTLSVGNWLLLSDLLLFFFWIASGVYVTIDEVLRGEGFVLDHALAALHFVEPGTIYLAIQRFAEYTQRVADRVSTGRTARPRNYDFFWSLTLATIFYTDLLVLIHGVAHGVPAARAAWIFETVLCAWALANSCASVVWTLCMSHAVRRTNARLFGGPKRV